MLAAASLMCFKTNIKCAEGMRAVPSPWLPDDYSQIFRSYMFGPLGCWTLAPLRYAAKFDPFLSLDCNGAESVGAQHAGFSPHALHPGAIQGK